jgi:hypothetical protein
MSDGVQRLPTAYLLPIVARTENSAFPLKGSFRTKYITPHGRGSHRTDRAVWTYRRAPQRCFARRLRRTIKRWRCAAIVFNYGYMLQRTPPTGFIAPLFRTKATRLIPVRAVVVFWWCCYPQAQQSADAPELAPSRFLAACHQVRTQG